MKKFYVFLLSLISLYTWAQGSINFDDDTKWTGGNGGTASFTSYSDHSYIDGVFSMTSASIIRNTTSVQDGFPGANGTYSLRLKNDNTSWVIFNIASGGVGDFSFNVRRWDGAPDTNFNVETSVDGGVTWVLSSVINATVTTDSNWYMVTGTLNSTANDIKIRIISNGTTERVMIDDFSWTASGTDPSISISVPADGSTLALGTTSVSVTFSTSNFTIPTDGHVHVQLDGANLTPNYMFFTGDPISISGLTAGSHTVKIQLVDANHSPLSPDTFDTVTFIIPSAVSVADIGALRADVLTNGVGGYYTITGEVLINYIVEDVQTGTGATLRNQKYVQDATGGLLIDDNTNILDPNAALAEGDGLTGLLVKTSLYGGVLQILPQAAATASSTGNVITPEVMTIADYIANSERYESVLIQLDNSTFADAGGTFAANTNYNISDGTTVALRTAFDLSDIIGTTIPTVKNVIALGAEFNGALQVLPRTLADFINLGVEDVSNFENSIALSSTIVRDNVSVYLNGKATVEVFNTHGQLLSTTQGTDEILVSTANLTSGVYLVRIIQDSQSVVKKIVKK